MVIEVEVLPAAGDTESHPPPSVVVTLVVKESAIAAPEGVVVKLTGCIRAVVEPI